MVHFVDLGDATETTLGYDFEGAYDLATHDKYDGDPND